MCVLDTSVSKNGSGEFYISLQSSRLEDFCKIPEYASITRAWLSACGDLFSAADELRMVLMGRRQCGMDLVLECFKERGRCHTIHASVSLPEDK